MQGDGGTKAEPLPQFPRNPSVLPGWDRVPSCAVWWPGVTLLTTRADAVYSTNSSLLLLLWFVIPHNAATQPELIILTKYTDSGDSTATNRQVGHSTAYMLMMWTGPAQSAHSPLW